MLRCVDQVGFAERPTVLHRCIVRRIGDAASMLPFEELHRALVLLRCGATPKGAEIATPADLWINLS